MKLTVSDTMAFRLFALFVASVLMGMSMPAHAAWQTPTAPSNTLAEVQSPSATGISATVTTPNSKPNPFYRITALDVSNAVAEQLQIQGVEKKAEVTVAPGLPNPLYSSDHAVTVSIHTLQIDTSSKRWQAQAYFVSGGKTESVIPVSGTYGAMLDVPVVSKQFNRGDIIEEKDIKMLSVPERQLRKDTIMEAKALIGQSPRAGISPNRPIHAQEITPPTVIKRGDLVEMSYNTPYIRIKATGVALEDGAVGKFIRVKNQKSERAISAQVISAGHVSVNSDTSL